MKSVLRCAAVGILCILANCIGRNFAVTFNLPGWCDTYGTFFAAYALGPIQGAVVGVISNLIFGLHDPLSAVFSVVSIFIGVGVGIFARKKYFETLFQSMSVAGFIAIGAVVLSTIINLIFFDSSTASVWGDGVRDYLIENGTHPVIALLIGELYLEFPDKLLTSLLLFCAIHLSRKLRGRKKDDTSQKSAILPMLLILLTAGIPAAVKPMQASAETVHQAFIQTVYNSENGLLCGHANAITETPDGILWIGTYAGLYRYNGTEFHHMDHLREVRNVNCLFMDSDGRLWIGTNDNGIAVMEDEQIICTLGDENGLTADSIRSITQSSDGIYYIGSNDGIFTAKLDADGIRILHHFDSIGYVGRIAADQDGHVAAVNTEGLFFLMKDSRLLRMIGGIKPSCCNFSEDGTLYVGTNEGLLVEYAIEHDQMKRLHSAKIPGTTKLNDIYPTDDGNIWICADNGIGYLDQERVFVQQEAGDFNTSVENMVQDYQGNLWFASSRLGLLRLSESPVTHVFDDNGLEPRVTNTTALYRSRLYVGTDTGLLIIDTRQHTSTENELTELLDGSRIRCILPDQGGGLWICSYGEGLVFRDRSGEITNLSRLHPEIGNRARTCAELSDGTVAVSTSHGLYFLQDTQIVGQFAYGDAFGHSPVLCLLEDTDGTLYAGTDGDGITVIRNGKVADQIGREDGLSSGVILRMIRDPEDGSIYAVTSNSICRMADGKLSVLNNFPYSNNYDILLDPDGEMFVTGSAGIYVVDKHELLTGQPPAFTLLNNRTGLTCSLTANAWNAFDEDKNVYLAADRGVFAINLDRYLLRQDHFHLMIPEVKADEQRISLGRQEEFSIARDNVKVEFFPEVINYTLEDPMVSYYLEGFDSDWTDIRQSELLSVAYTNLRPDDYVFHLGIRGDDGELIEERTYQLHKERAIYDNGWFRVYMIVVAGIFIGWLTWFLTRTQFQRTLELQQAKLSLALQQVQMGNETILAIAKTVDAKDVRTSKHSQRVSEYSALIAKEYGFTEAEQENIRKAALLHDIGKIGIPDSVLNKPARLTDEEYEIMKSHVTRGAEILKDFTLIDHVVEGARYHHERYDGKGYPDHLKGEEIPLYGRIISIADAFDAMTANRVYRKRQDFDYVLSELHKGRGTQFDPELLDIFLKILDDKKIDVDALYATPQPSAEE